jgi:type II secretory pathway component PulM
MNAREQRLLAAFGLIILIGIGFIGFQLMARWKKTIVDREEDLQLRKVEAEELLAQGDYWTARADWLSQKQPPYKSQKDADSELENLVMDTAKQHGVTIGQRSQEAPLPMDGSTSVSVVITEAKGPYEKVLRWLHSLQHPESFVAITGLTLKPDAEDTSQLYVTDIRIQKWYRVEEALAEAPAKP